MSLPPNKKSVVFEDFNFDSKILASIKNNNYTTPTEIQILAIPKILEGKDVVAQSPTGTGKTAAFSLPIIQKIIENFDNDKNNTKDLECLILSPTRELAIQISNSFHQFAKNIPNFKIATIYGGQRYSNEFKSLTKKVNVVIGTPGRIIDHINRKTLSLKNLKFFILDEADEMLRMGFIKDVKTIISKVSNIDTCQKLLFSATLSHHLKSFIKTYLKDTYNIKLSKNNLKSVPTKIDQKFLILKNFSKSNALHLILQFEQTNRVIIFMKTKNSTLELKDKMKSLGHDILCINGDMKQNIRERVIIDFKKNNKKILIATDVLSRGLDIDEVSHVINYDFPRDLDTYVHRVGRTGRSGNIGKTILMVNMRTDMRSFKKLQKEIKSNLTEYFLPSSEQIASSNFDNLNAKILSIFNDALFTKNFKKYTNIIEQLKIKSKLETLDLTAVLLELIQKFDKSCSFIKNINL